MSCSREASFSSIETLFSSYSDEGRHRDNMSV